MTSASSCDNNCAKTRANSYILLPCTDEKQSSLSHDTVLVLISSNVIMPLVTLSTRTMSGLSVLKILSIGSNCPCSKSTYSLYLTESMDFAIQPKHGG